VRALSSGHSWRFEYRGGAPQDTEIQARARAAFEFHCPAAQVMLKPLMDQNGTDTFQVTACGKQAVYTCIVDGGPCIRERPFGQ